MCLDELVSVPLRGFEGLRLHEFGYTSYAKSVSVPLRGFEGLRPYQDIDDGWQEAIEVSVPLRGFEGLRLKQG